MSINLPELVDIDHTRLDFQGIINLATQVIRNHPEYFSEVDDYTQGNAGRMTIELVSYIVELLADRIDWIANELLLPTATQKENVMSLLKLINYRLRMPTTAGVTIRASINTYIAPFVIPARYTIPGRDRDGNQIRFEMLMKNSDGKYVYEGVGSSYEFNTGVASSPSLVQNDLPFYQGRSHQEFFGMTGINNESVFLERQSIEEDSIRVWKVSRNNEGKIISRRELPNVSSFISPEAQAASSSNLPPFKIEPTENNAAYLTFGERPVVATFDSSGNEEIMVWYRTTVGDNGNIPRGSINYSTTLVVNGKSVRLNLVNTIAGSGGAASETVEHAKRYGPLITTTVNKTVNPEDFIIILQNFSALMNAIAYGKSNEPNIIREEYGYHIPPYETWIYPIFNKSGWESFPTYSYQKELAVGRPYTVYGPVEKELAIIPREGRVRLTRLADNAYNTGYLNVTVSDFYNKNKYMAGADYVIDTPARELIILEGGSLTTGQTVAVQYFENEKTSSNVTINFATGPTQAIPRPDIYPGMTTYAWSKDLQQVFLENNLSLNDYNHPSNDYTIDYDNNIITKNNTYPYLSSYETLGEDIEIISGINNEFILNLNGLDKTLYNHDHDIKFDALSGWARVGSGSDTTFLPAGDWYFEISIDGGEYEEYAVPLDGTKSSREVVEAIWTSAVDSETGTKYFNELPVEIFADTRESEGSPPITIMSNTNGVNSSISLREGHDPTRTLFRLGLSDITYGSGEEVGIKELARRLRFALNANNLCDGFRGQELQAGEEERPEIYSVSDLNNPTSFTLDSTHNTIKLTIQGTNLTTYDGTHEIVFNSVTGSTYDLDRIQERLDLIKDMQSDIDNTTGLDEDVIEVFWIRNDYNKHRIGFRLQDTSGGLRPLISIDDGSSNSGRAVLQFMKDQSSEGGNIVEAKVDPESNLTDIFKLTINLLGAFGENAFIQSKATNAIHTNTLSLLKLGHNQSSRGSGIYIRTLISEKELIGDGLVYTFTSGVDDRLNLTIVGAPSGIDDGEYEVVITDGSYNISELVAQINTSLQSAEQSGIFYNLSGFIKCEKQEGVQKIRIVMTDFDSTVTPDITINNNVEETINKECANKLGFSIGSKMSDYSTIYLHYAGDWISNTENDNSEERQIVKYLSDKKLISQDYIIKNSVYTPFDIKGTVYCSKGFDRQIIKDAVNSKIRENFSLDKREFADSAAISNITKHIESIEGTIYTTIKYFGKDYQQYRAFQKHSKTAVVKGQRPAEAIAERWSDKSAFKITLDGTATSGINYDGNYLVIVGDNWTSGDYDSLLNAILNGDGAIGGISHAIPLDMGRTETNLGVAISVSHSSGIFKFETKNEGPRVMISLDDPDDIYTSGYQTFTRVDDLVETEYVNSSLYSFGLSLNGGTTNTYTITSPIIGEWTLRQIASQINDVLPVNSTCGIDNNGKIRITSLIGGNQSTIDISADTIEEDLYSLLNGTDSPVDGSHGYISCLNSGSQGSLYIDTPTTSYGLEEEPTIEEMERAYNYKDKIPAKYNEILLASDDLYSGVTQEIENQEHGIILEYVELGRENG